MLINYARTPATHALPAGFKAADWQPVFPQGAASPFATANTVKLAPQQVLVLKKKPT